MKHFLLFVIILNLYCSTFKSKVNLKNKIVCSDNSLSLFIGYSETAFGNGNKESGFRGTETYGNEVSKTRIFYDIKDKLEKSCLFNKVDFDNKNADYTMEVFFENEISLNWILYFAAYGTLFTTGYWIIPFYSEYDMAIKVKLFNNITKKSWSQTQEENITTWLHPLLILTFPFYGMNKAHSISSDNIVNRIIDDISEKGILEK